MRLIDAKQIGLADMEIIMCDGSYKKAFEMLIDKIANAPTIDAVPVVRCKDCKIRYTDRCGMFDVDSEGEWTDDNGFCQYGERKEE